MEEEHSALKRTQNMHRNIQYCLAYVAALHNLGRVSTACCANKDAALLSTVAPQQQGAFLHWA